jgi:formylglycine-generating enzyme required for sulfatase activity
VHNEVECMNTHVILNGVALCPQNPVSNVSWFDAQNFIKKLNHESVGSGYVYRLPTEAEWEYAERAGSDTAYFFGDDPEKLKEYAWYFGDSIIQVGWNPDRFAAVTHPVAGKKKNAFGLYDMHGNLAEWMQDFYTQPRWPELFQNIDVSPLNKKDRVVRGGSYLEDPRNLRSAARTNDAFGGKVGWLDTGFRLVRTGTP